MTEVDGLVAWLRAQLAEDERVARAATTGPWRYNADKHWRKAGTCEFEEAVFAGPSGRDATCVAGTGVSDDPQSMADAEHIARWDPDRVLAEVEAKRRILDLHPHQWFAGLPGEWPGRWRAEVRQAAPGTSRPYVGCSTCSWSSDDEEARPGWWCETVRLLALPYSTRPGFREEWRP